MQLKGRISGSDDEGRFALPRRKGCILQSSMPGALADSSALGIPPFSRLVSRVKTAPFAALTRLRFGMETSSCVPLAANPKMLVVVYRQCLHLRRDVSGSFLFIVAPPLLAVISAS